MLEQSCVLFLDDVGCKHLFRCNPCLGHLIRGLGVKALVAVILICVDVSQVRRRLVPVLDSLQTRCTVFECGEVLFDLQSGFCRDGSCDESHREWTAKKDSRNFGVVPETRAWHRVGSRTAQLEPF